MAIHPLVLRNKGVPVEVLALDETGAVRLAGGPESAPVTEKVWIRFNNNTLCDIEDEFGSFDELDKRLAAKPNSTIRTIFALALDRDRRLIGASLDGGQMALYSNAISTALTIAHGVDPTQAAELWEAGQKAVAEAGDKRDKTIAEVVAKLAGKEDGSHGSNGSEPGVVLAGAKKSSGG